MKKPKNKKINILGVKYDLIFKYEEEDDRLKQNDGYFDCSTKKIVIEILKDKNDCLLIDDINYDINRVIRHEIMHAVFHESGMQKFCNNEDLVDLLAIQFPKILKIIEENQLIGDQNE